MKQAKYFSHLNTAVTILKEYQSHHPFDGFIKQFFGKHKKYGSKDRKSISQLCYSFFRTGKMLEDLPIEERIIISFFLCSTSPNEVLENLKPEWNDKTSEDLNSKIKLLPTHRSPLTIFPWQSLLSVGIEYEKFCQSFLTQPDLFIRLRPGKESITKRKLSEAGLEYKELSDKSLALGNASKLDGVLQVNEEAVIQDYSSQRIGEFLQLISPNQKNSNQKFSVWDCCAGSGGKSIMAYDIIPDIELTVSDIRPAILSNLKSRFTEAGINNYYSFSRDLATDNMPTGHSGSPLTTHHSQYNLILADVPCTGSGTWGRTPEHLYFFEPASIDKYSTLQKKIVQRVIPTLLPGGFFLYITCSVFRQENEDVVEFVSNQCGLTLKKMELLKGYELRADSMFAALFTL